MFEQQFDRFLSLTMSQYSFALQVRDAETCFRNGVNGKECMMRGICEAAETPLHEEGLIGELLHLLLTYVNYNLLDFSCR